MKEPRRKQLSDRDLAALKDLKPDETDRKNISELMKTYEKAFPYPHPLSIGRAMQDAIEHTDNQNGVRNLVQKNDNRPIRRLSLPSPFVMELKKAYPYIISSKVQYEWFLKNFPNLDLANY